MTAVACLVSVAALAWWGALALHHRALHWHVGEQARALTPNCCCGKGDECAVCV